MYINANIHTHTHSERIGLFVCLFVLISDKRDTQREREKVESFRRQKHFLFFILFRGGERGRQEGRIKKERLSTCLLFNFILY